MMRLRVMTPVAQVLDAPEVAAIRAADASGAFGILPGHADFVTLLETGALSWRDRAGRESHVAVRGGVLRVRGGALVEVAARDARCGDDLAALAREVLAEYSRRDAEETRARAEAARLHVAAARRLREVLEARRRPAPVPATPAFGPGAAPDGREDDAP
ncbi:F0F1 ATP synthase subunit epsilon [Oceanicella actignis]|uniref:F0F1 ATP synthase subunit epsilon n=1 Tax=Oceanicella actignis TaxID=1189325 RepID=UPI0012588AED|nr:F0F1 ATP synthase subunit epsilon [Oceanicella actignis]TYO91609.1 F-type H+-transporting ATPase subunit epsilon [Oceanicella actignis]